MAFYDTFKFASKSGCGKIEKQRKSVQVFILEPVYIAVRWFWLNSISLFYM
jgi:hypothetical protein